MVTALYVGHWEEGTGVSFSNLSLVILQQCSGGSDCDGFPAFLRPAHVDRICRVSLCNLRQLQRAGVRIKRLPCSLDLVTRGRCYAL